MKQFLFIIAVFLCTSLLSQQMITPAEYDQKKAAGQLDPNVNYRILAPNQSGQESPARYDGPIQTQSVCNCMIPLDTTFQVVPFTIGTSPDFRNDDGSSGAIPLPFAFNFYGATHDTLFINNNGNISFDSPFYSFTADSFPSSIYDMIAPFWADVDTRDPASGLVYYRVTATHMIVKWENVGYFSMHTNLLNTFQLIITDGTDTIIPSGSNVSFCYGDMSWTTGDASGGINGYGGVPSTVGCNEGNGVDYFQVTRNDQSGYAFDGPYGSADGVDWLDDQEIYFNTAMTGNVPPLVMNSTICDTIDVYTGDTLRTTNADSIVFEFYFMTPEISQDVTATITTTAPASALSYVQTVNTPEFKAYSCTFHSAGLSPGIYTVIASATDNGSPSAQNTGTVYINNHFEDPASAPAPPEAVGYVLYPNPVSNTFILEKPFEPGCIIEITDLPGQLVYSASIISENTVIDAGSFNSGIYFLNVVTPDGNKRTIKFIRE
ncbi:MAG TPA: nidogen-like domain-containing protein [Bacteroidia bacterium]|nr:nidogen-like domain-containing protein [Bacteroidia bacterium]